jgi:hypothetical protein
MAKQKGDAQRSRRAPGPLQSHLKHASGKTRKRVEHQKLPSGVLAPAARLVGQMGAGSVLALVSSAQQELEDRGIKLRTKEGAAARRRSALQEQVGEVGDSATASWLPASTSGQQAGPQIQHPANSSSVAEDANAAGPSDSNPLCSGKNAPSSQEVESLLGRWGLGSDARGTARAQRDTHAAKPG